MCYTILVLLISHVANLNNQVTWKKSAEVAIDSAGGRHNLEITRRSWLSLKSTRLRARLNLQITRLGLAERKDHSAGPAKLANYTA